VKEELVYCGVDVAKAYLDAAIGNEKRRLPNDKMGHVKFIQWIKQMEATVQVICEPSGGYERAFIQALVRGRVKVSLVQANRVRQFARAAGILAKTDSIVAGVLCAFGRALRPPTVTASNLEQEQLRELESQRRHLSPLLVMEQNRGAHRA
jgi:transposase